ncbi:hypothetical protein BKA07_003603 [Brevibacterium marinum]|uniref:Uncharacterized protein n=1 Tax=Brevibacterium marinum TaxID=418643 RepID=A0A846S6I2_9MICO|nr:hypothetical protein [Brevibacterium marinum]
MESLKLHLAITATLILLNNLTIRQQHRHVPGAIRVRVIRNLIH